MVQTDKTPLLQKSVAEEDHIMIKWFCNDDMAWIILRCKTQTWKFMGRGRLPGKRIVACSANKVTTCSSVYQSCQVVVNSMLRQQGDTTLIIYQSCHAIVKQDDSHYTWLTLLRFYLRIWLSPSWILPIAANAFPASVKKSYEQFQGRLRWQSLPYRPGDKKQLKAQDVTAKLVRFDILRKVPKNILFCINSLTPKSVPGSGRNEKLSLGRLFAS